MQHIFDGRFICFTWSFYIATLLHLSNVTTTSSTVNTDISPKIASNNKEFKDFLHVVGNFSGSENSAWEIIKEIKRDFTHDNPKCKPNVTKILENIKQNLTKQSLSSVTAGHPSDDLLTMAGQMFIYIKTNPRYEWIDTLTEVGTWFDEIEINNSLSPKEILLFLSNLKVPQGHIEENIARIFFETLSDVDNFIFDKVDDLTSIEDIGPDITTEVKG